LGFFVVFIGAGLGGVLRQAVNLAAARLLGPGFPHGTLAVNLAGSLLIGAVTAYAAGRSGMPPLARLFLTTGILGGFTTFSAFSLDTAALWEDGRSLAATGYVVVSVIGSIAAVFIGLTLTRALLPPIQS
jgi:CrcB protein